MNRALIGIALLIAFASSSLADDLPNFFVAPLSTELHHATVSSNADVYAIVNCNALLDDDDLDLSALRADDFVSALSKATASRGQLLLICRYHLPTNAERKRRNQLRQRVKELCSSAGYSNVRVSETSTSAEWKNVLERAEVFHQPNDADEPLIENDHVRVFPIRTKLSRFIHGEADCIVEVVHPVDGRMKEISSELEESIRQAVQQAQLTKKHTMKFILSSTSAGRDRVESLFDARSAPKIPDIDNADLRKFFEDQAAKYKPSPAMKLALDLGFQEIVYSHSPGGGAPETLIDVETPNFRLDRLHGDELDLHAFIDGRPALITFWGLACGPCRKEAPSLTALHKKHGQEFAVVAVNGYNDEREAVAKYVTNESLAHPIVLQGQTVADDLYHVGAYPTTFWVDRNGTVVDYEVGFSSSKQLEDRVAKMLEH